MKKDLIILKSTGKIVMIENKIEFKHGIAYRFDGKATPSFDACPFINPYTQSFKVGPDYLVVNGVQIDEELFKTISKEKYKYKYDVDTKKFSLLDTYLPAGYDKLLTNLVSRVEALEGEEA